MIDIEYNQNDRKFCNKCGFEIFEEECDCLTGGPVYDNMD